MYCNNCGNQVNGEYCSNCGNRVNNNQMVQGNASVGVMQNQVVNGNCGVLVINRKSSFIGVAIDITITIDGNGYLLGNGKQLSFNLTPGVHVVTYKVWCRRLKTVEVNVVAGGNYLIDFTPDLLWGGFKLSKNSKLQ